MVSTDAGMLEALRRGMGPLREAKCLARTAVLMLAKLIAMLNGTIPMRDVERTLARERSARQKLRPSTCQPTGLSAAVNAAQVWWYGVVWW